MCEECLNVVQGLFTFKMGQLKLGLVRGFEQGFQNTKWHSQASNLVFALLCWGSFCIAALPGCLSLRTPFYQL